MLYQLSYSRSSNTLMLETTRPETFPGRYIMVEGGGFEPPKALPADLQSAPFDHSGTPPLNRIQQAEKIPSVFRPLFSGF